MPDVIVWRLEFFFFSFLLGLMSISGMGVVCTRQIFAVQSLVEDLILLCLKVCISFFFLLLEIPSCGVFAALSEKENIVRWSEMKSSYDDD